MITDPFSTRDEEQKFQDEMAMWDRASIADFNIPNKTTIKALREPIEKMRRYHNVDTMMADILHKPLPKAWTKVTGILHGRAKAMQKHVATVRQETI